MDNFLSRILGRSQTIKEKYDELTELIAFPEIAADGRYWRKLVAERNAIEQIALKYSMLIAVISDKAHFESELSTANAETKNMLALLIDECGEKTELLTKELNALLQKNEFDCTSAMLEIKAADSADASLHLAFSILAMYESYAKAEGFDFKVTELSEAGQNKVKFAAVVVSGFGAHTKLKYENGSHKSMSGGKGSGTVFVAVFPKFENDMENETLDEKDIKTDVFHSGGPGGQNVNKVESAVRLTHLPTGISVTCRNERSQLQNKAAAMKTLEVRVKEHYAARRQQEFAAEKKEKSAAAKSEKIRTYNGQIGIVTDHRTGVILDEAKVFGGEINEFIDAAVVMYGKSI